MLVAQSFLYVLVYCIGDLLVTKNTVKLTPQSPRTSWRVQACNHGFRTQDKERNEWKDRSLIGPCRKPQIN